MDSPSNCGSGDDMKGDSARPLCLAEGEIRRLAHQAADIISDYLTSAPQGPAILPTSLGEVAERVSGPLPEAPGDPEAVLGEVAHQIAPYGVHNAHPRFFGYVGTSAEVSAVLADGIAAALNLNVVTSKSRPTAVQVELTVLEWLRQLLGLPHGFGGLLTSGGTMANLLCLVAARQARAPGNVRREGIQSLPPLVLYASQEAHVCHQKIAEVMGLGSAGLKKIPADAARRMRVDALRQAIDADRARGALPLAVIATAGSAGTGAVDPVSDLADLCEAEGLWLHVDGCYGGFALLAAADAGAQSPLSPEVKRHLEAMARADSLAADPHKFLFIPVEAAVAMVREPRQLWDVFSVSPDYLVGGDHNFFEYGLATSRAFRALKIWVALRHHGWRAFAHAIADNIRLARYLYEAVEAAPDLEPAASEPELSIVCFRYLPGALRIRREQGTDEEKRAIDFRVDRLNDRIVADLQASGDAYVSSASVDGRSVVRACIVNYRSTREDVDGFVELVSRLGARAAAEMAEPGFH